MIYKYGDCQTVVSKKILIDYINRNDDIGFGVECLDDYLDVKEIFTKDSIVQKIGVYLFELDISGAKIFLILKSSQHYKILKLKNPDKDAKILAKFLIKYGGDFSFERKIDYFKALYIFSNGNKSVY